MSLSQSSPDSSEPTCLATKRYKPCTCTAACFILGRFSAENIPRYMYTVVGHMYMKPDSAVDTVPIDTVVLLHETRLALLHYM